MPLFWLRVGAKSKTILFGVGIVVLITASISLQARGESYPNRFVRLVVPIPAGGPSDTVARLLAQKLGSLWGQQVVVDNRAGANSEIGTAAVASAEPDGYTLLLLVDSTMTIFPYAQKKLPYNPSSILPITTLVDASLVLVASSKFGAQSMSDAIRMSKSNPGKTSIGVGTFTTQLAAAQLARNAGIEINQIPYKGSTGTTQAILSGEIDLAIAGFSGFKEHVGGGEFKILAQTGTKRADALADVPTFSELGLDGFGSGLWIGLAAPAGTPPSIVAKINADVIRVMNTPEMSETLSALALEPMLGTPESTANLIKADSAKWEKVIEENHITLD